MFCSTHIIKCLKSQNIQPEASSSSSHTNGDASLALNYDLNSGFLTEYPINGAQWWTVNFKHHVSLIGYQIYSCIPEINNICIYNWTLSISLDNKTWRATHDPEKNKNEEKLHMFNKPFNAVYARIDGNSYHSTYTTSFRMFYVKFFGSLSFTKSCITCKIRRNIIMRSICYFAIHLYS